MKISASCLVLTAAGLIQCACGPTAGAKRPDWSEPYSSRGGEDAYFPNYYFMPCADATLPQSSTRGFVSILLALRERNWIIESSDFQKKVIAARACLRNDPMLCATLYFHAGQSGRVTGSVNRKYPPPESLMDDIERWTNLLEAAFSRHRCMPEETLQRELDGLGFSR